MKQVNVIKQAINSMLSDYQEIKNLHWFLNNDDKQTIVLKVINKAFETIQPLLNDIHAMHDVPFNITVDLIKYETWLFYLIKTYNLNLEISDIEFRCRYELPQSGYDCVYLDYESDKPFLCLV